MGVDLWGDLPSPKATARQEVPCTRTYGIQANGYYQKYEPKASRRSRESGGVSARRGPKEDPPKGRDEPPRNASRQACPGLDPGNRNRIQGLAPGRACLPVGRLAQHNKARRFRGQGKCGPAVAGCTESSRLRAVALRRASTSLSGEIWLPCGGRLMSKIRKGFTRLTKNPACPFAVGGYESRREPQNRQRLMTNPAAPGMATYWVSKQKSAEGTVGHRTGKARTRK
jgi:hypothetical protein